MASHPKTYKAVVIDKANAPFDLKDVELKHPGKGQVLVKVLACGVCFSDVGMVGGQMGNVFPRVPGHEIVGDLEIVRRGLVHRQHDVGNQRHSAADLELVMVIPQPDQIQAVTEHLRGVTKRPEIIIAVDQTELVRAEQGEIGPEPARLERVEAGEIPQLDLDWKIIARHVLLKLEVIELKGRSAQPGILT